MSGPRILFLNIKDTVLRVGNYHSNFTVNCVRCLRQSAQSWKENSLQTDVVSRQSEEFEAPSPYKNPGPRRYGYHSTYKTQGCLPRNDKPVNSLPPYKPKDSWATKAALFGQNDYIDILGDGDIHPSDLLTGPPWLVAFKGNERERLLRKMEWQGPRLRLLYPVEFNRMEKRIRYLTKVYNTKRHNKRKD